MGCIQFFQIGSNDISIERTRQADPHSKMEDANVAPVRRYRFLKFKTCQILFLLLFWKWFGIKMQKVLKRL